MTRLVVIGGGITGLAAGWEASERGNVEVVVVEASPRFGGKLMTSAVPGLASEILIDEGADAFLARVPDAVTLCKELDLDDELTQPSAGRALVHTQGGPKPLPTGTVLGVPYDFGPLSESGLLSPAGLSRARAEVDTLAPAPSSDVTIGAFLSERYGRELVDNVVAPLIGGINAGDVDQLSLAAVTPQLAAAAADGGSLTEALRKRSRMAPPNSAPVFRALTGGSQRLTEALTSALGRRGVQMRTSAPVTALGRSQSDPRSIDVQMDGESLVADRVLICTPAFRTAPLLANISSGAANLLQGISYASVALVTMVFDRGVFERIAPDTSGILVPRSANLLVTAASFGSHKWSHWNDGRHAVVRISAGHSRDTRGETLSDEALVDAIRSDLIETLSVEVAPVGVRVSRWQRGFAQYEVGHLSRVDEIEEQLTKDCPRIAVAGASYRGLGIPACISQGRLGARRLLD